MVQFGCSFFAHNKMHCISELPSNYTYIQLSDEDDFFYTVRVKEIKDKPSALIWLEEYSNCTNTTWRTARTYPQGGRLNAFKIDMRCVRSTDRRAKGIGPSKNTSCPAKIQVTVLRYHKKSRAKKVDPLTEEWPAVVTLRGSHNHPTTDASALKYRDVSKETKMKLRSLYGLGHSPTSALHCLKMDLLLEHSENYSAMSSDAHYIPTYSVAHKLHEKEFSSQRRLLAGRTMLAVLQKRLDLYSRTTAGSAKFFRTKDGQHCFVAICSPVMCRAHQAVPESEETVMVDAFHVREKQRYRTYVFQTVTRAGGIPLAIIVSDSEKRYVFEEAVDQLKGVLPRGSFYGSNSPSTFVTNNDLREPLQSLFPRSRVLLCQCHFLRSLWSFLCSQKGRIDTSERQELYCIVRSIVFASTESEAVSLHESMLSSRLFSSHPDFAQHYLSMWQTRRHWATYSRTLSNSAKRTSRKCIEPVFRLLRNSILNRVMTFNFVQFIDFILTRLEAYLERVLIDFSRAEYEHSITEHLLNAKTGSRVPVAEIPGFSGVYRTSGGFAEECLVDIKVGVCTCGATRTGKLCEHACAAILHLGEEIRQCFRTSSVESRELMFYVATGNPPPSDIQLSVDSEVESSGSLREDNARSDEESAAGSPVLSCFRETPAGHGLNPQELREFERLIAGLSSQIFPATFKSAVNGTKELASSIFEVPSAGHDDDEVENVCEAAVLSSLSQTQPEYFTQRMPSEESDRISVHERQESCSCCSDEKDRLYGSLRMHDYIANSPCRRVNFLSPVV